MNLFKEKKKPKLQLLQPNTNMVSLVLSRHVHTYIQNNDENGAYLSTCHQIANAMVGKVKDHNGYCITGSW